MRGAWDLGAVRRLARLVRERGVTLVHTHSSVDAWLGGMAARLAGRPVVRTRHVSIPVRRRGNLVYTRLADRVVTSGEAIRAVVVAAGVAPDRVVALPAGVNLEEFRWREPGDAEGEAVRKELQLGSPLVGSVAMFRGSKGHVHLLDAMAGLRQELPVRALDPRGRRHPADMGGAARPRARSGRGGHVHRIPGRRAGPPRRHGLLRPRLDADRGRASVAPPGVRLGGAGGGERCWRHPRGRAARRDRPPRAARRPGGPGPGDGHRPSRPRRGAGASPRGPAARRGAPFPPGVDRPPDRGLRGRARRRRGPLGSGDDSRAEAHRAPSGRQPLVDGQRRPRDSPAAGPPGCAATMSCSA